MSEQTKTKNWMQTSITFRMGVVGFLIVVLLIPLSFIKSLIYERKQRESEAIYNIHKSWGQEIRFYGPVLKLPYYRYSESTVTDSKTKKTQIIKEKSINYTYFFPEKLDFDGDIQGEIKNRGMYTTSVYNTNLEVSGSYLSPNIKSLTIDKKDVLWEKAQFIIKTTNLKGINDAISIQIADQNLTFESNFDTTTNNSKHNEYGNYADLKNYSIETMTFNAKKIFDNKSETPFSISFNASGSRQFHIIPIGKETKMHLTSKWKDTNFNGEYLPYNPDKITEGKDGFDAHWKVLQMNRPFSQQFRNLPDLDDYSFGVEFIIPVDNYQQNERSAKYGYLMISLTFLLFFLIQTLSKINIHPFQYLMIGLALVIFYTLLISISEHSNFTKAYLIASSAVIILITLYSKSILKIWKFPVFIGISITSLYAFIYVIIQLENYALLVGSIGLFVILAAVMYTSRKIEWN